MDPSGEGARILRIVPGHDGADKMLLIVLEEAQLQLDPMTFMEQFIPVTGIGGVKSMTHELLKYGTDAVDAVFLPYTLAISEKAEGEEFLKRVHKLLKPGGLLVTLVPDLDAIAKEVEAGMGEALNSTLSFHSAFAYAADVVGPSTTHPHLTHPPAEKQTESPEQQLDAISPDFVERATEARSGGRGSEGNDGGERRLGAQVGVTLHMLMYGRDEFPHRYGFTRETMAHALQSAGFLHVKVVSKEFELWSVAYKPRDEFDSGIDKQQSDTESDAEL